MEDTDEFSYQSTEGGTPPSAKNRHDRVPGRRGGTGEEPGSSWDCAVVSNPKPTQRADSVGEEPERQTGSPSDPGRQMTAGNTLDGATLSEKLQLLRGEADPTGRATGYLPGVERLGVEPLRFVDGPLGVVDGESTAFPATVALGASWDPELARRFGRALGRETRANGHDVVLAPGANLVRVPTCGRNFEYPGEDPHHAARLTAATVAGVEATGAGATLKHFVVNNQERNRDKLNVVVGERALRELYLPAFRAGVDAGASVVMTAYNRVGGHYASEHRRLLERVLRRRWGFDGVTVSDWWGTHDTVAAATAGLDVEMPGVSPVARRAPDSRLARLVETVGLSERLGLSVPLYWRVVDRLLAEDGQPEPYPPAVFDDRLRRAVDRGAVPEVRVDEAARRVARLAADGRDSRRPSVDRDAHRRLAETVAVRGTVLLQNRGLLPLDGEQLAVLGPAADEAKVSGGGSAAVTPSTTVDPVTALRRTARVTFERGVPRATVGRSAPVWRRVGWDRHPETDIGAATRTAAAADAAVVVVEDDAGESADRSSLRLPGLQDRLVRAVAAANPQTVVVCRTSGPVAMPWRDDVAAIVQTWYPGQADGDALAAVLNGRDPGGRLPVTFGERFDSYPVRTDRQYPGVDGNVHYDEGVFVGYRGFDRDGLDPTFPFGHGLSYADFEYDEAVVTTGEEGLSVDITVRNVADRPGREVVQAYVVPPATEVPRPERELGWFRPVRLDGGASRRLTGSIPRRRLARFDTDDGWVVDSGQYEVLIGRSSRDARLSDTVRL